jgi:hypothetical protein
MTGSFVVDFWKCRWLQSVLVIFFKEYREFWIILHLHEDSPILDISCTGIRRYDLISSPTATFSPPSSPSNNPKKTYHFMSISTFMTTIIWMTLLHIIPLYQRNYRLKQFYTFYRLKDRRSTIKLEYSVQWQRKYTFYFLFFFVATV